MKILAATAATALIATGAARAEEPASLGIGSRVRIQAATKGGPRLVGVIAATDAETLTLSLERGETREVPWSEVRKIHVSRGRRSVGAGALRGAGIGLALGVTAGLLAGAAAGDDPPCPANTPGVWSLCFRFRAYEKAQMGGYVFGMAGTALGAAAGAALRGERWAPVGDSRVRVSAGPGPGGRGAGMSVSVAF